MMVEILRGNLKNRTFNVLLHTKIDEAENWVLIDLENAELLRAASQDPLVFYATGSMMNTEKLIWQSHLITGDPRMIEPTHNNLYIWVGIGPNAVITEYVSNKSALHILKKD